MQAREHARKVMQTLLSVEIASEERGWMSDTEKWIDGIGKWIVERRSSGGLSDGVESQLHDMREHLLESVRSAESSRPPGSAFSWENVKEAKLRRDLEDLAEEAWTAAFTRIVHDPLVNSFDDTVERAKSGG